ncbi:hypothetical protein [Candidatus Albibeggiatoa sp. nov. NOAA]|uniref:hypothetical protein n=1 Tax=Candidatus Albibeggiatoa sp. nov. NOAA TaxID=3162724 RepID=UPI0032F883CF|nr:hypothetical protein [Thiotrichaceae bacterium]
MKRSLIFIYDAILFIVLVIAFITLLFLSTFIVAFNPIITSSYNNYTEIIKSDVIKKGWFPPEIFPESAYDIFEKHNIDISVGAIQFYFTISDTQFIHEHFQKITFNNHTPLRSLIRINTIKHSHLYIGKKMIQISKDQFRQTYLLINWKKKRAIYWY